MRRFALSQAKALPDTQPATSTPTTNCQILKFFVKQQIMFNLLCLHAPQSKVLRHAAPGAHTVPTGLPHLCGGGGDWQSRET